MRVAKFFAAIVGLLFVTALFVRPACGCTTKTPSYHAAMKSDLRNLVTAQEAFFSERSRYALSMQELGDSSYRSSPNVTVALESATDSSWRAVALHSQLPAVRCTIWIGTHADSLPDDFEGEPVCNPPYKRKEWEWVWEQ